jgi:hypothetical protein
MTSPRRSTRITGLHSYHEAVRPCAPHQYSTPRGFGRLGLSLPRTTAGHNSATGRPRARDDRFTRSASKPKPSSRHLHAGHRLANRQAPARLIPGSGLHPVLMSSVHAFDTSSVDRFRSPSWPTPAALRGATFPQTLTTTTLDRSSLRWFAASPYRAAAEDRQPTGPAPPSPIAAPHQTDRPSTSNLLVAFRVHTVRSAFRRPCSPWLVAFPPPPPPPRLGRCSPASQVVRDHPTSHDRPSRDYGLGLPRTTRPTITTGG